MVYGGIDMNISNYLYTCMYSENEICYKELAHKIVGPVNLKFAGQAGRLDPGKN